jgi:hypothetical protein
MNDWRALPAFPLRHHGELTAALALEGVRDFQAAARWVHELPYGRNVDRSDHRLVLTERRGTCSTKHALLAALAAEQALPVRLVLGIFEMHEGNTPGVGPVLARYGLARVPEAHCLLKHDGRRIDVTRVAVPPAEPRVFLHEEEIVPAQIGRYKVERHQRFLRDWVVRAVPPLGCGWETVWRAREECIAALSRAA